MSTGRDKDSRDPAGSGATEKATKEPFGEICEDTAASALLFLVSSHLTHFQLKLKFRIARIAAKMAFVPIEAERRAWTACINGCPWTLSNC